jgi:hypothetical protein
MIEQHADGIRVTLCSAIRGRNRFSFSTGRCATLIRPVLAIGLWREATGGQVVAIPAATLLLTTPAQNLVR